MSKQPRESLVQYQPAFEVLLSESKAEEKKNITNLDSRLAIDCTTALTQNYFTQCSPHFSGTLTANTSLSPSAPTLLHVKM
jgi:hypothetical protein